jgi:preprotein translocase subunit SecG
MEFKSGLILTSMQLTDARAAHALGKPQPQVRPNITLTCCGQTVNINGNQDLTGQLNHAIAMAQNCTTSVENNNTTTDSGSGSGSGSGGSGGSGSGSEGSESTAGLPTWATVVIAFVIMVILASMGYAVMSSLRSRPRPQQFQQQQFQPQQFQPQQQIQ